MARLDDPEARSAYVRRAIELVGCFYLRCTDHLPLVPDIGNSLFGGSSSDQALSGGEPLLFMDFCGRLLRELKARGIHTFVETCGHFAWKRYVELVEPQVDQVYVDLKLVDDAAHRRSCGTSNRVILENFRLLHRRQRNGGSRVLVARTVTCGGFRNENAAVAMRAGRPPAGGGR